MNGIPGLGRDVNQGLRGGLDNMLNTAVNRAYTETYDKPVGLGGPTVRELMADQLRQTPIGMEILRRMGGYVPTSITNPPINISGAIRSGLSRALPPGLQAQAENFRRTMPVGPPEITPSRYTPGTPEFTGNIPSRARPPLTPQQPTDFRMTGTPGGTTQPSRVQDYSTPMYPSNQAPGRPGFNAPLSGKPTPNRTFPQAATNNFGVAPGYEPPNLDRLAKRTNVANRTMPGF